MEFVVGKEGVFVDVIIIVVELVWWDEIRNGILFFLMFVELKFLLFVLYFVFVGLMDGNLDSLVKGVCVLLFILVLFDVFFRVDWVLLLLVFCIGFMKNEWLMCFLEVVNLEILVFMIGDSRFFVFLCIVINLLIINFLWDFISW